MAGSYVSQLVSGKLSPEQFVAKSAGWLKEQKFFNGSAVNWLIEALEKLLIAKGIPAFLAEVLTNEIREALGIVPPTTAKPDG